MNHELLFKKSLYDIYDENQKILYFIDKEINILEKFSHIIKKKNLEIYVVIPNEKIYLNMKNRTIGEELDDKVFIYKNIEDINPLNNIFNYINIFDLSSIEYLEFILKNIYNLINYETSICIYCTMSNESDKNIKYKNFIREIINSSICNVSTVIKLSDFFKLFTNKEYIISCINIYKKNNYIIYGDNTIYNIVINKKTI